MRFSRFAAGWRVGADFFERRKAVVSGAAPPLGLVDAASELAGRTVDAARIHPAARRFLERTGELELVVHSRWSGWAWPLWRVARPIFGAVGQLVLPLRQATIRTRLFALDAAADGRPGARGVVREYADTGRPMQTMAYAVHAAADGPYMSTALPLPLGNLTGQLRLEAIDEDPDGRLAVRLTSDAPSGGVWFVTSLVALRLPLRETLSLWGADMECAPADLDPGVVRGTVLVGRHEQRLFGALAATHDYWFYPRLSKSEA